MAEPTTPACALYIDGVPIVDTFLRLEAVKQASGLGRSTIYDLMAEDPPRFPRPVKPGGENAKAVAWLASEVSAWQRKKVAERDALLVVDKLPKDSSAELFPLIVGDGRRKSGLR